MDTKEYLTEENYQKGKRALKLAAIIVLAISLVAGVTLITLGILTKTQGSRSASALSANDVLAVETEVPSSTEETSAKNRNSLHQEALEMWKEMDEETEAEVEAVRERNEATANAADEKFEARVADIMQEVEGFVEASDRDFSGTGMIMAGAFVIFTGLIISGFLFMFAHRREVLAFTTQQTMPVAQETVEKVAPTAAKAAGAVSESVAEGIARGIKKGKS